MKIENALILAAGLSSRFVPICFDKPKGLLNVKGEILIERQIRQLNEVGIHDIFIVVGAYASQFAFLKEKYNVHFIFNPDYQIKNNFSSFFKAKDILGNTLISSADLYFSRNIFVNSVQNPYYASVFVKGETNQRCLILDKFDKIVSTRYSGNNTWITFGGHAVLSEAISKKICEYISLVYNDVSFANKYWVDFQDKHLSECPMYIKRFKKSDILEFNDLKALQNFDINFRAIEQSKTMLFLCEKLQTTEKNLTDFLPIKEGNTAIGCTFVFKNDRYAYFKSTKHMEMIE